MLKSQLRVIYFFIFVLIFIISLVIQAQDSNTPNDFIPELIGEINLWRISSGLEPLVYNQSLEAMAISQANYLVSLSSIPNNIHAGQEGESARQRSQFPEFQWANYGNPSRFAITEIGAIGSVRSAMGFWTTSQIHANSALNPTYREVGIAARQLGSDVLFIVVMGGQPDVLPALSDAEAGEVYLTTERNEWSSDADWMGEAVHYRFLDAEEMPITDFAEWQARVSLPQIAGDFFYVEYEDANGKRVRSEVQFYPRWYTGDAPEIIATETPISAPTQDDSTTAQTGFFATNTPMSVVGALTEVPTMMPTPTITPSPTMISPTATPIVQRLVRFIYTDTHFTLLNTSAEPADLFELSFRNGENIYNASRWEAPMADLDISVLSSNHCLQIGGVNNSNDVAPVDACRWIRSFVTLDESRFFWTAEEFEVINRGIVIRTCSAIQGMCDVELQS